MQNTKGNVSHVPQKIAHYTINKKKYLTNNVD